VEVEKYGSRRVLPGGTVRGNDQVLMYSRVTKGCRIVQNINPLEEIWRGGR